MTKTCFYCAVLKTPITDEKIQNQPSCKLLPPKTLLPPPHEHPHLLINTRHMSLQKWNNMLRIQLDPRESDLVSKILEVVLKFFVNSNA